jgi:UMF1 family MFS transporter
MTSQPLAGPSRFTATSWVLLDWAASAFSTVVITLVVAYVKNFTCADRPWGLAPGVIWAWTLAAAMLASAVIAPGISAWADRRRRHKTALLGSVAVGAGSLFLLAGINPSAVLAVLGAVVFANIGFDMAAIFTGSLLAMIATGRMADRLSAFGFAAGYAGGALALVLATAVVGAHESLGLTISGGLRAAFAVAASWWILFSLPAAFARFESARATPGETHYATAAGELLAFAQTLARPAAEDRHLAAVVFGSMLVLGSVQTAIAQFSSVAEGEFSLSPQALVRLILLVQAVALPGALAVGWLSERFGRRAALAACLAGWSIVLCGAWFVRTEQHLYGLAVLLALVLGGVQSAIRAAVADAAPEGRAGVTFGLLQVGAKLAGAMASLAFGGLELISGQPRAGLAALLAQILVGWWLLRRMNGRAASGNPEHVAH